MIIKQLDLPQRNHL